MVFVHVHNVCVRVCMCTYLSSVSDTVCVCVCSRVCVCAGLLHSCVCGGDLCSAFRIVSSRILYVVKLSH